MSEWIESLVFVEFSCVALLRKAKIQPTWWGLIVLSDRSEADGCLGRAGRAAAFPPARLATVVPARPLRVRDCERPRSAARHTGGDHRCWPTAASADGP